MCILQSAEESYALNDDVIVLESSSHDEGRKEGRKEYLRVGIFWLWLGMNENSKYFVIYSKVLEQPYNATLCYAMPCYASGMKKKEKPKNQKTKKKTTPIPQPKLSNVALGFTDANISSHQPCRRCSTSPSFPIQPSHNVDRCSSTGPRFYDAILLAHTYVYIRKRGGNLGRGNGQFLTDFSRSLISHTRRHSASRTSAARVVTAATKKGHVG